MKFITQNWKTIAIIALVVIVAIVIYYFAKGKKIHMIQPAPLPTSGGTDFENEQIRATSLALHNDMDGWNAFGHNMDVYERLLVSSDNFLTQVYNDFNGLYIQEGKGTLKEWIEDEQFAQSDTTDAILLRFTNLNLQ
jgi:hypothetical protein